MQNSYSCNRWSKYTSAFNNTFTELNEIDGFAGAIGIDSKGNMFWKESHPKIVFAAYDGGEITLFE